MEESEYMNVKEYEKMCDENLDEVKSMTRQLEEAEIKLKRSQAELERYKELVPKLAKRVEKSKNDSSKKIKIVKDLVDTSCKQFCEDARARIEKKAIFAQGFQRTKLDNRASPACALFSG
mgnify:CR=1 FL=1